MLHYGSNLRGKHTWAWGGMSGHWPGGGVVFDPSGGEEENFVRGGIGGGTKVKFSSGRLWRPKIR